MKQFAGGALSVILLAAILALSQDAATTASNFKKQSRFRIYGAESGAVTPILLDTQTGRSWTRQIVEGGQAVYPVVWTPIHINPSDTTSYDFDPLQNHTGSTP